MSTIQPTLIPELRVTRTTAFLRQLRHGDWIAYGIVLLATFSVLLIVGGLVYQLWVQSAAARQAFGWKFLVTSDWDPANGQFGALPFIYGTVVTATLALLIAVPLGLGCAIFLAELASPMWSAAFTFLIELLAAVPSVIYGLLGIFVMVPILNSTIAPPLQKCLGWLPLFSDKYKFYGVSFFSAGVVLAIMIVPFIVSVSREVILAVPTEQRDGSLALGATRWETTWKVILPYARNGIFGSIILALARALGETMAVTMVIGNTPQVVVSLLRPGSTTAAVIANEFAEANDDLHVSALIELGLVLFGLTIVVNIFARLLIVATGRQGHRS